MRFNTVPYFCHVIIYQKKKIENHNELQYLCACIESIYVKEIIIIKQNKTIDHV